MLWVLIRAFNEFPQYMFSSRTTGKQNIIWIPPLIWSYVIAFGIKSVKSECLDLQMARNVTVQS